MRLLNIITTGISFLLAACALFALPMSYSWVVAALFLFIAAFAITTANEPVKGKFVARLKGFNWTREDFCRGWLITGDTGSGKTRSGINQLLFQVFENDENWGGLCIDDKGIYWETLVEMAKKFNRENDLILLQVKPDNAPHGWTPAHTYNLLSDPTIPPSTYAKFVVDTVTSLGQRAEQSFFKSQAQTHIGLGLEALDRGGMAVSLENVRSFLLNDETMDWLLKELSTDYPTARDKYLVKHFTERYRNQPPEQMGGVKETIANYLQFFLTPDISQIFCAPKNTFEFHQIDLGKIICVAMPQKYQVERRYINTFLKMLFYTHALRRFDRPKEDRADDNLLILWADEAQRFVTASDEGMSDYNCIDVMREARATLVAAAQSSTSFIPPLGEEKAQVLTLNLRNRIIFKAADEAGAVESANFLGQRRARQKTVGTSSGMISRSYHQQQLAALIHSQMQLPEHRWEKATGYKATVSKGFSALKENAYTANATDDIKPFRATVPDPANIKRYVFGGFSKCLYEIQKFDVDTERRFAVILEDDGDVLKWFKPARNQFQIYYNKDAAYEPDFVVETKKQLFLCEPKRADQIQNPEVVAKKAAASEWCKHATEHAEQHGGKKWSYLLIPHDAITGNMTLEGLASRFAGS